MCLSQWHAHPLVESNGRSFLRLSPISSRSLAATPSPKTPRVGVAAKTGRAATLDGRTAALRRRPEATHAVCAKAVSSAAISTGVADNLPVWIASARRRVTICATPPVLYRVLYQRSRHEPPDHVGYDYDVLDIVLYADALADVVLWDMDLAYWVDNAVTTINSFKVYDGVPFPFLTPTNEIFSRENVAIDGDRRLSVDFGGISSHMLWIRIDASNLGSPGSEDIAIDNLRFGQKTGTDDTEFDPAVIDAQLQVVPEASALLTWLLGATSTGVIAWRKWSM